MYSVIDIGSNTIRLVIYDTTQATPKELLNTADFASLISYVNDGELSSEGVSVLTASLNNFKKISEEFGSKNLYAFATASLRDVKNKDKLIETISHNTGIVMDILSGTEEVMYDFEGLKSAYNADTGAAFDLGGGSCQLMFFEHGLLSEYKSMPIGALKMYNTYVCKTLPTEHERQEIRRFVRKQLSTFALLKNAGNIPLFAMGGAASTVMSIHKKLTGEVKDEFTVKELTAILDFNEDIITKLAPKRLKTLIPAMVTVLEICDYIGTDKIRVTNYGVRDGIIKKLAEKS